MSITRASTVASRSEADPFPPDPVDSGLLRRALGPHVDAFVTGGLGGLARERRYEGWVQFGLTPLDTQWHSVLADLGWLARHLLDEGPAVNFFFMRRPPGLRVRFETAPEARDALADRFATAMTGWPRRLSELRRTRYEPEEQLFGGALSTACVHRLFTVDSLAWLAHSEIADRRPPWLFSLSLLRQLMDGLAIRERDEPDVWDRVRSQAERNVPVAPDPRKEAAMAAQIRTLWTDPTALRTALGEDAAEIADDFGDRLLQRAQEWHASYFASGDAVIGTREAAAFATLFHWNRGGVSSLTQRLIAAALSDRV